MRAIALLFALALVGCRTDQQTADVRTMTDCEKVSALVSSPSATPGQIAAAMEVGRNKGCFGPAQPKTVIVR